MRRDVVVIGGSAGAHNALGRLAFGLPADLAATVLVTVHLPPDSRSVLAPMLERSGRLPAAQAVDGETAKPGRIYTAAPDRHLLMLDNDVLHLGRSPRQNRVRPAIDATFRSVARWCGGRVIGVVLSGTLDDGSAGLAAIARAGGAALVQRPDDARFESMPAAALRAVPEATALPADHLGRAIAELVGLPAPEQATGPDDDLVWETDVMADGHSPIGRPAQPVALGCPECSGGMYLLTTGNSTHYACHVGHSFSPETLLAAREDDIEDALWTAISALQEKATVLTHLAGHEQHGRRAEHLRALAEQAASASDLLRDQLMEVQAKLR